MTSSSPPEFPDDFAAEFPDEQQWLSLPPPPISRAFVDATLAAVRSQQARLAAGEDPEREIDLPAALLAQYRAPAPAGDFVAAALSAVRADRSSRLRALLRRYIAPEPTPDFVARTLRALRGQPPARRRLLMFKLAVAGLAAAALLLLYPWPTPAPNRLAEAVLAIDRGSAAAFSPAPVATIAAAAARAAEGQLPVAAADGLLLLAAAEDR